MRRSILLATAAFALAACGSQDADADGDGEISADEVAAQSGDLVKPEPGLYRSTVELVDLEMPNASPEAQDMMRAMMSGGASEHTFCLTPEQAEQGFEEMLRESQREDGECSYDKFETKGGSFDAVLTCKDSDEGLARIAMQGTGTGTSSTMTMTIDTQGPDEEMMTMTMKQQQERIGDCKG